MLLKEIKQYLVYIARWQASTPIVAIVIIVFAKYGEFASIVIANLVGGLIFFWVDKYIFCRMDHNNF